MARGNVRERHLLCRLPVEILAILLSRAHALEILGADKLSRIFKGAAVRH